MTKQSFKPNIEEDLNRLHNVSLTEGQISTILYILEGYNPLDSMVMILNLEKILITYSKN